MNVISWIIFLLSLCTAIFWCLQLLQSALGVKQLRVLPSASKQNNTSPKLSASSPLVSVIIVAKEEEQHIKQTIRHLLEMNYTNFEIIAVNDRSADRTGKSMEEIRAWSEGRDAIKIPIRVVHITSLPKGWLGKNHAMYQGYLHARGEILLFTDADVLFRSSTLTDAVQYMKSEQAEHLTLMPKMVASSFVLRAFVNYFLYSLCFIIQPHVANDDLKDEKGIGVGAFNMINRAAYEIIGTHKAFPMHPDDDLQLGQRVKQYRLRQRALIGREHIQVEWYPSLSKAIEGLEKNFFSGFNYSLLFMIAASLGQLLFFFMPFVGLLLLPDWSGLFYLVSVLAIVGHYLIQVRMLNNEKGLEVLVFPLSCLLLVYVMVRSTVITLRQGGIYWRGTFYKLEELKEVRKHK